MFGFSFKSLIKYAFFGVMGIGILIAVVTADMSIFQRILALGVVGGFSYFIYKLQVKKIEE